MERPNLYHYLDNRSYLRDFTAYAKKRNSNWSYGLWARKLGVQASTLSRIVKGQREMGEVLREKLISYLELDPREAEYFRDLALIPRLEGSSRATAALLEGAPKTHAFGNPRTLSVTEFDQLSNWQSFTLWLLVRSEGFREDPEWIRSQLLFEISDEGIRAAFGHLIACGMLARDSSGKLIAKEGRVDTTDDVPSARIRAYHSQMLSLARDSLEKVAVDQREFSASTFLMASANVEKAKKLIREFARKMGALIEEPGGDSVYQFNMQLFPMTRPPGPQP